MWTLDAGVLLGTCSCQNEAGAGAAVYNRGEALSLQQDWRGRVWGGGGGAAGCCCGSAEIRLGVCVCPD